MKKVLIICNGDPPSEQLFRECRTNADYLIAADGGGNIALRFGEPPDAVIGDLDSFEGSDDHAFEIIFKPDQESNDLEKALQLALQEEGTHIQILGATGFRVDQTLKNLSVLKQFNDQFEQLRIADNFGELRILDSPFKEEIEVGTLVSLFPLSGTVKGVTTIGLKFPLKNESLKNGVRDGSSNEVVESPIQITHKSGDLLMFIGRDWN